MTKQKAPKKRPKKKGPAPRKTVEAKKGMSRQQIIGFTIAVLVIGSMSIGLLISAFAGGF